MSLVAAAEFHNGWEASLAQGRLAAAGIEAVLFGLDQGGFGLGMADAVRLMVLEEDLAEAQRVLAETP